MTDDDHRLADAEPASQPDDAGAIAMGEDENLLLLQRDMALRQAKLSKADLQVIRMALNESRPLEALRTCNEAIDRLDEELDSLEDAFEAGDRDE